MPETIFRQIERDNFAERAYQSFRQALMEGRFTPGHRLKVRDVAQMLGVSMTPFAKP